MRPVAALLVATLTLGAGACSDDAPEADTATEETVATEPSATDPLEEGLVVEVRALRTTVATARELLADAAGGDAEAAGRAVAALTADDRLTDDVGVEVAPLFPGPDTSREETIDYGDAFTRTLTAARGASGAFGSEISQVLADPIAGDPGIWQRDAEGLLDAVDAAARSRSVEDAETAVLELPGEGTRALAYALLAARATGDEDRRAFAERGIAHLDVVLRAIDTALDGPAAGP